MSLWSRLFGSTETQETHKCCGGLGGPSCCKQKPKYNLKKVGGKQFLIFTEDRDLLTRRLSDKNIRYREVDDEIEYGVFELIDLETVTLLDILFDLGFEEDISLEYQDGGFSQEAPNSDTEILPALTFPQV